MEIAVKRGIRSLLILVGCMTGLSCSAMKTKYFTMFHSDKAYSFSSFPSFGNEVNKDDIVPGLPYYEVKLKKGRPVKAYRKLEGKVLMALGFDGEGRIIYRKDIQGECRIKFLDNSREDHCIDEKTGDKRISVSRYQDDLLQEKRVYNEKMEAIAISKYDHEQLIESVYTPSGELKNERSMTRSYK